MAQTNVSFEMNEKLRDEMAELCDELGMSIDDAFQIFARKMVNEQEMPFEITEDELDDDDEVLSVLKWTAIIALAVSAVTLIIGLIRKFKD